MRLGNVDRTTEERSATDSPLGTRTTFQHGQIPSSLEAMPFAIHVQDGRAQFHFPSVGHSRRWKLRISLGIRGQINYVSILGQVAEVHLTDRHSLRLVMLAVDGIAAHS